MNTDHRRPLVAFVLVAMAGALVLFQGQPGAGSTPLAEAPGFRGLFDPPGRSEGSVWFPLQDGVDVRAADTVPSDALAPSLGVVEEALGGDFTFEDTETGSDAGSGSDSGSDPGTVTTAAAPIPASADDQGQAATPAADTGPTESQLVYGPRAGQADGGALATPGDAPGHGGSQGTPGDGGGDLASPPADGGPAPSGPGRADKPAPHSFDDVPDHAHPYGHGVGKQGSDAGPAGPKSDHAKGPKDKGAKDKGAKDKGAKAKGAKDKGAKAKGAKDKGAKAKGPKAKGPKAKGAKAKGPKAKGGPR